MPAVTPADDWIVFVKMMALPAVPATAGHVMVADPEVEPNPEITQEVVTETPQFRDEKEPAAGVVPPIAPGAAIVAPPKLEAFKLATLVVDATVNGAVPVASVEVIAPVALIVLNAPVDAVPPPIAPGAAKVAPFNVVALLVPLPLTVSDDPVPSTIAAVALVPEPMVSNVGALVPHVGQETTPFVTTIGAVPVTEPPVFVCEFPAAAILTKSAESRISFLKWFLPRKRSA